MHNLFEMNYDEFNTKYETDDNFRAVVQEQLGKYEPKTLKIVYDQGGGAGRDGARFLRCSGSSTGYRGSAHNAITHGAQCCAAFSSGLMAIEPKRLQQLPNEKDRHSCGFTFSGNPQLAPVESGRLDDSIGATIVAQQNELQQRQRLAIQAAVQQDEDSRETPEARRVRLAALRADRRAYNDSLEAERARRRAAQEADLKEQRESLENNETARVENRRRRTPWVVDFDRTRQIKNKQARPALAREQAELRLHNQEAALPVLVEEEKKFSRNLRKCIPYGVMIFELAHIGELYPSDDELSDLPETVRKVFPTAEQLDRFIQLTQLFAGGPSEIQNFKVNEIMHADLVTVVPADKKAPPVGTRFVNLKPFDLFDTLLGWSSYYQKANDNLIAFFIYVSEQLDVARQNSDNASEEAVQRECVAIITREFQGKLQPPERFIDVIEPNLEALTIASQDTFIDIISLVKRDADYIEELFDFVEDLFLLDKFKKASEYQKTYGLIHGRTLAAAELERATKILDRQLREEREARARAENNAQQLLRAEPSRTKSKKK